MNDINQQRIERITQLLENALVPSELHLHDESHLHAGHAGAKSGKGHFSLSIKSERFQDLTPIKSHQLIYHSLGDMMQTDIHALRIKLIK